MEVKISKTLLCKPLTKEVISVTNFLVGQSCELSLKLFKLILGIDDWKNSDELKSILNIQDSSQLVDTTRKLILSGILIPRNSELGNIEAKYLKEWEWGEMPAYLHFGTKDTPYFNPDDERKWLTQRKSERSSPELYSLNNNEKSIKLPPYEINNHLRETLFDRRTERRFSDSSISLESISDCLFSGLGIIGFYNEPLYGKLPLKMAPSGGARNPYECYLVARKIEGLSSGIYHYAALQHNLEIITEEIPTLSKIIGNQEWADNASGMLILIANFKRDMWKYPQPAAYRPVILEAGHIIQNILITATELNLKCCPTAAISDSYIEKYIPIDPITEAAIHTVSIGNPLPEYKSWYEKRPKYVGKDLTEELKNTNANNVYKK